MNDFLLLDKISLILLFSILENILIIIINNA